MSITLLRRVILRDLAAVRREIEAYERTEDLWTCPPGVANSAGTLALHLAGNLQYFVGAVLGGTGYVRTRDVEFSARDVPAVELQAGLDRAAEAVQAALGGMEEARWNDDYPEDLKGLRFSVGLMLLHLASHLAYHLGQIDYHRRIVTGSSETVGAVSMPQLAAS